MTRSGSKPTMVSLGPQSSACPFVASPSPNNSLGLVMVPGGPICGRAVFVHLSQHLVVVVVAFETQPQVVPGRS